MQYAYLVFTLWMFMSLFAGMVINATFTMGWLKEHGIHASRDFKLGHISNHLRALDLAKEFGQIPAPLLRQKSFYLQAAASFALLAFTTMIDFFGWFH